MQPGFSIVNEFLNNSALKKFFIEILDKIKVDDCYDKEIFDNKYIVKLLKMYKNNGSFNNNEIRDLSSLVYHSNYFLYE